MQPTVGETSGCERSLRDRRLDWRFKRDHLLEFVKYKSMSSRQGSPAQNAANGRGRRAPDPLAQDDAVYGGNAEAEEDPEAGQRRRGPRGNRQEGDVPPVRDATGEKVLEGFQNFLKRWVESRSA